MRFTHPVFRAVRAEKNDGAIVLHFLLMFYVFIAFRIISHERLIPSLRSAFADSSVRMATSLSRFDRTIAHALDLSPSMSHATILAVGHAMPLALICWVGTFFAGTNIGLATTLGAMMFHQLCVTAMCISVSKTAITLTWWQCARDFIVCTYKAATRSVLAHSALL